MPEMWHAVTIEINYQKFCPYKEKKDFLRIPIHISIYGKTMQMKYDKFHVYEQINFAIKLI